MPFTAGLGSYVIVWIADGSELTRETSGLKSLDEVVRYARAKMATGAAEVAGKRPTEFTINDETGIEIDRHPTER
jgi:hypothetical protein